MVELASSSVVRRTRDQLETPPERPDDSQIDLTSYVAALWRGRWIIALVALMSGGVAFANAMRTVRTYEATAVLTVSQSKLTDLTAGAAPSTAGLKPLVTSRAVAQDVLRRFELDKPPYGFTASSFLEHAVQIEDIRNTGVLRLSVRLRDPELAAQVANALAARAVQYAQSLSQEESVRVKDLIKAELDAARRRMDRAAAELLAGKRRAQLEMRRADVDAMVEQRAGIPELVGEIERKRAEVARAEQELGARSRIDTIVRRIDQDPALLAAARDRTASETGVLGLELKSQEINDVYAAIDERLARHRAELAGLERRRSQLVDRQRHNGADTARLRELYEHETQVAALELEHELAQKSYEEIAGRYEGARLQVASRSVELQVLDPATPPDRPLSRQVARRTATGLAAGVLLASACVLALSLVAARPKR